MLLILGQCLGGGKPDVVNPGLQKIITGNDLHIVKRTVDSWEDIVLTSPAESDSFEQLQSLTLLDI